MVSQSELPDSFSEIEEVYKSIVKHELMVDAIRNVVSKGGLAPGEEEHVMLALNPTEIGNRENGVFGLLDEKNTISKLPTRNIPALKGLVEKELNETFDLMQKLDNATKDISTLELTIPSTLAELQMVAADTSDDVHKLYKRLKIFLGLHTTDRISCLKKQLDTLTLKASEVASGCRESENAILRGIFHDASNELLADVEKNLEIELAAITEECVINENKLKNYEAEKVQLMPLAVTLARLDQEIAFRKVAIKVFSE